MPKKSGGKSSRARGSRPGRQSPRPAAVLPFERKPAAVPQIGTPGVTGSVVAPVSPARGPNRTYRPPRIGGLIPITDYGYVLTDLRRIGLLALAAFLVLGGLTFVVH